MGRAGPSQYQPVVLTALIVMGNIYTGACQGEWIHWDLVLTPFGVPAHHMTVTSIFDFVFENGAASYMCPGYTNFTNTTLSTIMPRRREQDDRRTDAVKKLVLNILRSRLT